MKTVIWKRRLIDGTVQEVSFTALFSEDDKAVDTYLEEMARRQGLIRNQETFMDEMRKVSLAYEIDLILAQGRDEVITAAEYYVTKAMILTVRYGMSEENDAHAVALKAFQRFLSKIDFNPSELRMAS